MSLMSGFPFPLGLCRQIVIYRTYARTKAISRESTRLHAELDSMTPSIPISLLRVTDDGGDREKSPLLR